MNRMAAKFHEIKIFLLVSIVASLIGINNSDASELSQDVTTFVDVTADALPDVATFAGDIANRPRISVFSGRNGEWHSSIDYINSRWQGLALATVRDANQDSAANDPAVAMLVVNKTTGKIRVETRDLATTGFLGSIQFLNQNWRAVDVVVVDDLNGDGSTNDTAIAVLAERISDGRVLLQLRDFASGALISNVAYFDSRWTPIAAAVADRSAVAPVGARLPLIGVLGVNPLNDRRLLQSRLAGSGILDDNVGVLDTGWELHDVTVNHDADGNGIADDPVWQVLATTTPRGVILVNSRFVGNGEFARLTVILNPNWDAYRLDALQDTDGNMAQKMAVSAIRRSDGVRRVQIKDYATGATTTNIAP